MFRRTERKKTIILSFFWNITNQLTFRIDIFFEIYLLPILIPDVYFYPKNKREYNWQWKNTHKHNFNVIYFVHCVDRIPVNQVYSTGKIMKFWIQQTNKQTTTENEIINKKFLWNFLNDDEKKNLKIVQYNNWAIQNVFLYERKKEKN